MRSGDSATIDVAEPSSAAKGKAALLAAPIPAKRGWKKGTAIIDFVLRLGAITAALAAAATMGTSDENLPFFTQFFQFEASYDDMPTFQFFLIGMAFVGGYLVLSLPFSIVAIVRPHALGIRLLLIIMDTVALTLATSCGAAAAAIVYLAHNGNSSSNWLAICNQFGAFCQTVSGAVVAAFVCVENPSNSKLGFQFAPLAQFAMSQTGKLMPNLDQHSTKMLNLTVLQRIDPFIEEILITAAHVTFYEFNIESNQWSRKDVEGSLFVVKRNTQPRFQFIVMNRRNTDNLVENLLGDFEYEVQVPYLLYRNAAQEVNGIWFYNSRECEEVANLFTRILSAYSKVPSKPKVSLSSSKSEFEELEAVPSLSVMEGPLEPSSTAFTATDAPEDPSFINFFSAAMNIGGMPLNAANSRQTYHSSTAVPPSSFAPSVVPSPAPTPQVPALPLPASSTPTPLPGMPDPNNSSSSNVRVTSTNLVKPSSFFAPPSSASLMIPPISSSMPTVTALHAPQNLQRPYGTPLLQPFPPPAPSPSLTPNSSPFPVNDGPLLTRDKVRDALLMLVQDDQFIDMFHQALMKAHQS
ncbi:hypothetical protein TIFTF001_008666 [Ficus carica]|uniref:Casparian strip membrane protein domain-containing protein n=1 Tax=Ficus carica TaxID=3494 RepID=A0AA87ZSW0_FICCA|nr:hypothetical protein TIFTF001_008666 [Ficus carica]